MNFIDISSWQAGIDLPAVFAQNPIDGVIVKATQDFAYVNPEFRAWAAWLAGSGKPFGFYHYCAGGDPAQEAEHFYSTVRAYIGRGVPAADYEGETLSAGTGWLRQFLDRFYGLSGVRCMIYCSLSVLGEQDFSALAAYPLWIAQYADMAAVRGFLETPWQRGSVAPFAKYAMHQYTGNGRLNAYGGALDLDKFCGTVEDWNALAGVGAAPTPAPVPTLKPADPAIVLAVLKNEYGTGEERIRRLRADGYDPTDVQSTINRLCGVAAKVKKDIGDDMSYLNSILWIARQ